jgi:hypothetical protein
MPTNDEPRPAAVEDQGKTAGTAPAQGSRTPIVNTGPKKDPARTAQRGPGAEGDSKPVQTDDKALSEALQNRGFVPNENTASGIAASPPKEIVDTASKDVEEVSADKNSPAQEPGTATFLQSGQLEHNSLPSNQGPVPASVTGSTEAAAQGKAHAEDVKAQQKFLYDTIDEAAVNRMGRSELTAHAEQRGYDIGQGGTRVLRARFLEKQKEDKNVEQKKEEPADAPQRTSQNVGGVQIGVPATPEKK